MSGLSVLLAAAAAWIQVHERSPESSSTPPAAPSAEATAPNGAGPEVAVRGCPEDFVDRLDSGGRGPLRLAEIVCFQLEVGDGPLYLAPDDRKILRWNGSVEIRSLDGSTYVNLANFAPFRNLVLPEGRADSRDPTAWSSDSRFLWSVRQDIRTSQGMGAGLTPITIDLDGLVRVLPTPHHSAGPLDGLQWTGGDGAALALFGARGVYLNPQRMDPAPTLAIIDAVRGQILDELPARDIVGAADHIRTYSSFQLSGAVGTVLPDGRVRAVLQVPGRAERRPGADNDDQRPKLVSHPGTWLVWTQGETPLQFPSPFPAETSNPLAISPDGSKLLVMRQLQPDRRYFPCRNPPCRESRSKPVTGALLELRDASSLRMVWSLRATAVRAWYPAYPPVISPSGRYALVFLPSRHGRQRVGLVSMADGRLRQALSVRRRGPRLESFGFSSDEQRVWLAHGGGLVTYRFGHR